jgi:hypothetical protein
MVFRTCPCPPASLSTNPQCASSDVRRTAGQHANYGVDDRRKNRCCSCCCRAAGGGARNSNCTAQNKGHAHAPRAEGGAKLTLSPEGTLVEGGAPKTLEILGTLQIVPRSRRSGSQNKMLPRGAGLGPEAAAGSRPAHRMLLKRAGLSSTTAPFSKYSWSAYVVMAIMARRPLLSSLSSRSRFTFSALPL